MPEVSRDKTNENYEHDKGEDLDESKHMTNDECHEKAIEINSPKSELKEVQEIDTDKKVKSKPLERVLQLSKAAPSRRQVRDRLGELGIYDTRPVVDSISYR